MKLALLVMTVFMCAGALPVKAQTLYGGVDTTEILPKVNFQLLAPQSVTRGLSFTEHCACINPKTIQASFADGRWHIGDDSAWLLDFGSRGEVVGQAVATIQHFGFTQLSVIGGASSKGLPQMQYFLASDQAPAGVDMPGEDVIPFDVSRVKAELVNGSWKITEGNHWMLDFGNNKDAAVQANEVIHYYGFTKMCYVGRPGAPMMYFRK